MKKANPLMVYLVRSNNMDDLYLEWEELVELGKCTESFEDWYSGLSDKYDDIDR